jgi:LmbE family N-acetylglucosaminyl deacetylase
MSKKILVVSPHPDDETLGCGGTLLKHKDSGDSIYWLNITNMEEEYEYPKEKVEARKKEIEEVIKAYKFDEYFDLCLRPAALTEKDISFMVNKISEILEKVKPNILYVPFWGDAHSDHRVTFNALQPFFKSFRYSFIKKVLMMEIISETDNQFKEIFKPNVFIDISNYFYKKIDIMKIYKSEIGNHPFPRSIENIKNLALYRGSQSNCNYAESFMLLKEIW